MRISQQMFQILTPAAAALSLVLLQACVSTSVTDSSPSGSQAQVGIPDSPLIPSSSTPATSAPRCVLVVDSTSNHNTWLAQKNSLSEHGIFDNLKASEKEMLRAKAWTVLPFENSLFGDQHVKDWAAAQSLPEAPSRYVDLSPEDQVRYLKEVVEVYYGRLTKVQVIRLMTRPSELHTQFYGRKNKWKTNELGLFVTLNKGAQSIYRVGMVDFRDDARKAWPHTQAGADSVKYERTSQLSPVDWDRLAQLAPTHRAPAEAKNAEADRVEIAVHLSLVENFIYFLPDCSL